MEYENRKSKKEILETIGQWASLVRLRSNWSVIDIANMTGYSRGTIYSFEHGKVDSAYLLMIYIWLHYRTHERWVPEIARLLNNIERTDKTWLLKD